MKLARLLLVSLLSVVGPLAPQSSAAAAPQDNWRTYSNYSWSITGYPRSLAVGPGDEVYVAVEDAVTTATTIQVFSRTGALLRNFVSIPPLGNSNQLVSMAFGPSGTLYTLATDRLVRAYAPNGTLSSQWGGSGAGAGLFGSVAATSSYLLAVDTTGHVYVGDLGNRLIQRFDSNGVFQNQWGGSGTLAGQFGTSGGLALGVTPQDKVVVASQVTGKFLQLFNPDGSVIATPALSSVGTFPISSAALAITPDGLIAVTRGLSGIGIFDSSINSVGSLPAISGPKGGFAFNQRGDYYVAISSNATGTITRFERGYSVDNAPVVNALPQPLLIATEQRPSTPYVDIDYKVVDADDATARVALLGFVDGSNDLGKVLKLSTFVEGTASHVGLGQPTNEVRRVTWNAAADWSVEFGNVQIEVLAQDSRGLLPVHWITLPAQGADPVLDVSQRPVTDAEWLHLWYWLIAIGDPGIALANGQISGVGGAFDGQVLATTESNVSSTTDAGRAYLRAKCGVRSLTADEIARASAGQFGLSTVTEASVARLPDPAL